MITDEFSKNDEAIFLKTIGRFRPTLSNKEKKSRVRVVVRIRSREQRTPTVIEVFENRYHLQRKGGA